ncbi:MAG TPA: hypothetical protein VLJ59_11125 [Mycobacteriales bacterium]|nr:hypothetical protein [Mycobacteriales bacterium]
MSSFEERLLAELRPLVGTLRPEGTDVARSRARPEPQPVGRRIRALLASRPRVAALALATVLVGGGMAVGTVAWPQRLATPAYAVDERPDGSIVVTLNSLSGSLGLQQTLQAAGLPVTVLAVSAAESCPAVLDTIAAPGALVSRPGRPNMLTIRRDRVPAGSTVVLGLVGGGDQVIVVGMVVHGPAPRCLGSVVTVPH